MSTPPAGKGEENEKRIHEMFETYKSKYDTARAPAISAEDLSALMMMMQASPPARIVLVDAREREERAVSQLAGSVHADDAESAVSGTPPPTHAVYYCTAGLRSGMQGASCEPRLRELVPGIEVRNLAGGIVAASHAIARGAAPGLRIVDKDGADTRSVHVYGDRWSLLPDGWTPVLFGRWRGFVRGIKFFLRS
eukprot:TRINITY_DN14550_c0_g1_i1.p1 TRINITY_DN14550_c0_g1~~TRINITY_DN14550_c0_g1_i1.p1  ORF type:complete len:219 (+),score=34.89 TRINITY_DN14550_c0_g1_i1:77-658(+)